MLANISDSGWICEYTFASRRRTAEDGGAGAEHRRPEETIVPTARGVGYT